MKKSIAGIVLFVFLAMAAWMSIAASKPPQPLPSSAPETEFSAERAMVHLKEIAREPHPLGSAAHDRVRDYLLAELRRMGVEPQVQSSTGIIPARARWGFVGAGSVENVLARLKGTSGGKAVALAAHYDSVPAAPGAGDDGAGVAAMLETLRALQAGPPLKHDVLFLFTDGEESGLLGAAAFTSEHPWANEIGVLLNFEARGNAGPSLMFETSSGNAALIRAFAQAAPDPQGTSLAYEIYQRMPNDTDFTMFRRKNIAGLNFAFIDGWAAYHTPHDSVEELDRGSLQHHGSYMLSLARRFGNADAQELSAGNAVYFNLFGASFASYSAARVVPSALLLAVLFAWLVRREMRSRQRVPLAVVWGAGVFLLSVLLTLVAGWTLSSFAAALHGSVLPAGDVLRSGAYMLSLLCVAAAVATGMYSLWRNKLGAAGLALGGALGWLLLTLLVAWSTPGGSYLCIWPLLGCLLAVTLVRAPESQQTISAAHLVVLALCALPAVLLLTPAVAMMFTSLGVTSAGAVGLAAMLGLAFWLLTPQIELMTRAHRWLLPGALLAAGVVMFLVGAATTRYSSDHPKPNRLYYGLNTDNGKAVWAMGAAAPDVWTAQYLTHSPARDALVEFFPEAMGYRFMKNDAPAVRLASPEVLLGDEKTAGGNRTLTLLLMSPRRAQWISVYVPDAEILSAKVNGKALESDLPGRSAPPKSWRLVYSNPPASGVEVTLQVRGTAPVKMRVIDGSTGLPEIPGKTFQPRPDSMMPIQSGDTTLVSAGYVF